jgi:hypothetical protein
VQSYVIARSGATKQSRLPTQAVRDCFAEFTLNERIVLAMTRLFMGIVEALQQDSNCCRQVALRVEAALDARGTAAPSISDIETDRDDVTIRNEVVPPF